MIAFSVLIAGYCAALADYVINAFPSFRYESLAAILVSVS